jgi:hypothetical protein
VALCQARISTKPLWGFSSSNPYHSQSRAEHLLLCFINFFCKNTCHAAMQKESKFHAVLCVSFNTARTHLECKDASLEIIHKLSTVLNVDLFGFILTRSAQYIYYTCLKCYF